MRSVVSRRPRRREVASNAWPSRKCRIAVRLIGAAPYRKAMRRGMPRTRHAAVLGLLLSGLHTSEISLAATTDVDLDNSRVRAVGAARITARHCPLEDPWCWEALRLRAEYVQHQSSCDRPETLTTSGLAPANQLQSSVCTAFGEVVRASGVAPEGRSATPQDVSIRLAAKIHSETGQIADVALRLGLSSLNRAATNGDHQGRGLMGTPKRRPAASKPNLRSKKKPDYVMGPTPKDVFSFSRPEPPGPAARALPALERLELLVANPDLYDVTDKVHPGRAPGTPGRRPAYSPFVYLILLASISISDTAEVACASFQHEHMGGDRPRGRPTAELRGPRHHPPDTVATRPVGARHRTTRSAGRCRGLATQRRGHTAAGHAASVCCRSR
ncbi:hypothetical protein [Streptomyces shenzhenensis]|uniref:hypothetical protein n=1 Tax=Streptomyces shenzhenensis TaxID=943815 RepID=UPI001F379B8B|nr:hypothetical protein [Streptomyces shenzhenensis]